MVFLRVEEGSMARSGRAFQSCYGSSRRRSDYCYLERQWSHLWITRVKLLRQPSQRVWENESALDALLKSTKVTVGKQDEFVGDEETSEEERDAFIND